MTARKDDNQKPEIGLIPHIFLIEIAKVLMFGKDRYGAYNWTKGMNWSRLINACYRHLGAFNDGEDVDLDSRLSHLAHATCCLMFLYIYQQFNRGVDDRYKGWDNNKHGDEKTSRNVSKEQAELMESDNVKKRTLAFEDNTCCYYACGCIEAKDDNKDLVGCAVHYPNLVDEGN